MYVTHRERRAIIYALAIALSIIILTLCVAARLDALFCPPGVFC